MQNPRAEMRINASRKKMPNPTTPYTPQGGSRRGCTGAEKTSGGVPLDTVPAGLAGPDWGDSPPADSVGAGGGLDPKARPEWKSLNGHAPGWRQPKAAEKFHDGPGKRRRRSAG